MFYFLNKDEPTGLDTFLDSRAFCSPVCLLRSVRAERVRKSKFRRVNPKENADATNSHKFRRVKAANKKLKEVRKHPKRKGRTETACSIVGRVGVCSVRAFLVVGSDRFFGRCCFSFFLRFCRLCCGWAAIDGFRRGLWFFFVAKSVVPCFNMFSAVFMCLFLLFLNI